ncbi:MAG: hypothetical protein Q4B26_04780 [Eubacteriales bacterium]|nr:hypothetical protein [Eubacteriales bacterium]
MSVKTCGECPDNDDMLCDRFGFYPVEDEDPCRAAEQNEDNEQ